ncbi:hypothetical protein ACHAWF_014054 [Thalassiosira exigua]
MEPAPPLCFQTRPKRTGGGTSRRATDANDPASCSGMASCHRRGRRCGGRHGTIRWVHPPLRPPAAKEGLTTAISETSKTNQTVWPRPGRISARVRHRKLRRKRSKESATTSPEEHGLPKGRRRCSKEREDPADRDPGRGDGWMGRVAGERSRETVETRGTESGCVPFVNGSGCSKTPGKKLNSKQGSSLMRLIWGLGRGGHWNLEQQVTMRRRSRIIPLRNVIHSSFAEGRWHREEEKVSTRSK